MRCAAAPGGSRSPRPGPRRGRPEEAVARGLHVPAPPAPRPAPPRAPPPAPPRRPGRELARAGGRAGAGRGASGDSGTRRGPPARPPAQGTCASGRISWCSGRRAKRGRAASARPPLPPAPEDPGVRGAALEPRARTVWAARTCRAPMFVNKPRA